MKNLKPSPEFNGIDCLGVVYSSEEDKCFFATPYIRGIEQDDMSLSDDGIREHLGSTHYDVKIGYITCREYYDPPISMVYHGDEVNRIFALRKEGFIDFISIESPDPLMHLEGSQTFDTSGLYPEIFDDSYKFNLNLFVKAHCMKKDHEDWTGGNHLFVLLGLSGSGKSTLIDYVSHYLKGAHTAVKVTTRESRYGDKNSCVVPEDLFRKMQMNDDLSFCYTAFGNSYGYMTAPLEHAVASGSDVLFDTTRLDVALQIKERYPLNTRIVYVDAVDEVVMGRIVNRYSNMPDLSNESLPGYMEVKDKRLHMLEHNIKQCAEMREAADFVLQNSPLIVRQNELSGYILGQRFPGLPFLWGKS